MTRQETAELLKRLSTHYTGFVGTAAVAEEWCRDFADADYVHVKDAVSAFIRNNTKNYLPTIARIREYMPKERFAKNADTRCYKIATATQGEEYIRKIRYFVRTTRSGRAEWIEDEDGYVFSDPDDTVQAMLISRVRSTGTIASDDAEELQMLQKKLESCEGRGTK